MEAAPGSGDMTGWGGGADVTLEEGATWLRPQPTTGPLLLSGKNGKMQVLVTKEGQLVFSFEGSPSSLSTCAGLSDMLPKGVLRGGAGADSGGCWGSSGVAGHVGLLPPPQLHAQALGRGEVARDK